jgi:zinc transport system ATP-binding protein
MQRGGGQLETSGPSIQAPGTRRSAVLPVELRGVSFAYGADTVLDRVDLTVDQGQFVALVGPNGSGKSTLVRVLSGLLPPSSGTVRLFGSEPHRLQERWRLGYVPQRPTLADNLPATVREVVSSGRLSRTGWAGRPGAEDRTAVDHAVKSVALWDLRDRPISSLSVGQQQRVFIARAFASEPDLLVLDEPIAGVDADSQKRFRDSLVHLVHEHGAAVVLVSHELGVVAQDLARVVVLKRRILFDDSPTALARSGVSLGVHGEDLPLWLESLR